MPTKRPQRIERRAERVMGRAQKNYGKYEALRKSIGDREMTDNEATYADKLERRVARQETRAKNLKNKAQYIKEKKMAKNKSIQEAGYERAQEMAKNKPTNTIKKVNTRYSESSDGTKKTEYPAKTSSSGRTSQLTKITKRVSRRVNK